MSAFSENPFAYVFPVVLAIGFGGYYLYGAVDRAGVAVETVDAVVTGKQFTPGGTTYRTTVAGGNTWTQSSQTNDVYAIQLMIGKEPTVGLVMKDEYERLHVNDHVKAKIRRTRLSGRLEVVEVSSG